MQRLRVSCPDLSQGMALTKLESFYRCKTSAFISQEIMEMFLWTKRKMDKGRKFTLVVMKEDTAQLFGLTSNLHELSSCPETWPSAPYCPCH